MSWFYEPPRAVQTKRNGVMRLHRFLGAWKLKGHDGTEQSTPYMDALWRRTLDAAARRRADAARVLLLGVGMGNTFNLILRRFPRAEVVGIDWEPELFILGLELGVFHGDDRASFIEGDAAAIVPGLGGPFDLALIDLFNGHRVADAVSDPALQDAVAAKMAPGALLCVNGYDQPAVFDGWRARLREEAPQRYKANRVAVFRKD